MHVRREAVRIEAINHVLKLCIKKIKNKKIVY